MSRPHPPRRHLGESGNGDADQLIDALISREAIPADIRRIGIAGDPAARLVEVAAEQNASLLVIGSGHMPEGVSATLSQGASDHVAHYAPCPVVLVPPDMPAPT
jgi:nucleotide-binding universal stress UspA family protein